MSVRTFSLLILSNYFRHMALLSGVITLLLFFLLAVVVYYGTYNHNMSFFVNLFSLFSHVAMKFLIGEYVTLHLSNSGEKKRTNPGLSRYEAI